MIPHWLTDVLSLFKYYRTRFIFSLIGIMVGVSAICALVAIKGVVTKNSEEILKKYGGSRFMMTVIPMSAVERKSADLFLSYNQVSQFCHHFQKAYTLIPYLSLNVKAQFDLKSLDSGVVASTPQLFSVMQWPLAKGRYLHPLDSQDKVIVVGSKIATKLTDEGSDVVGSMIDIDGHFFTVVGVIQEVEFNPLLDFDVNQAIFMDLNLVGRFNNSVAIDTFIVQGTSEDLVGSENHLKTLLTPLLGNMRLFFKDALIFQKMLFQQVSLTLNVLAMVAGVTLLLGIVSILNLLFLLMDERKKEIGLRLALGATSRQIAGQFLRETMCLCVAGGLGGILVGQALAYVIISKLNITYYWQWFSWFVGIPVSVLLGLGVGILPARMAVKYHPMTLLQS